EGENRILVQWAINNPINTNEETIAEIIKKRLSNVSGIPFIEIIREAFIAKKIIVVRRLLDTKVPVNDQIDILLILGDKNEALQRALTCGNNDLVLYVLMRIKADESPTEFMMRLEKIRSLPLSLHLQCLEEIERKKLHTDLIKKSPNEKEKIAYSCIIQRFGSPQIQNQKTELSNASKLFKEVKNDFIAHLVDDEQRLITRQDELEKKILNSLLKGLSLCATIEQLMMNNEREAEQLKKEFNMPDKRYWWIKIQVLAKKSAWSSLADFGKKPSSPIGYEPFIDICLKYGKLEEAKRYVDKSLYSSKLDEDRVPYMYAKVQ
ncbi:unnamed protein product, partial [Didymodactylos carnosus]